MNRQDYYPSRQSAESVWLMNFADKLPKYAAVLPLLPTVVASAVADALCLAYATGAWLTMVRGFAPACTASLAGLRSGTGMGVFTLPLFQAPALPAGVVMVPPGALDRIFALVQIIKNSPGYTTAIGLDLGIVAPASAKAVAAAPKLNVTAVSGPECEQARLNFLKSGHKGAFIQSRRGGGDWEDLGITTKSPRFDARPLLQPDVPEIREYRACYWDDDTPSGDWSAVVKVTLSP